MPSPVRKFTPIGAKYTLTCAPARTLAHAYMRKPTHKEYMGIHAHALLYYLLNDQISETGEDNQLKKYSEVKFVYSNLINLKFT